MLMEEEPVLICRTVLTMFLEYQNSFSAPTTKEKMTALTFELFWNEKKSFEFLKPFSFLRYFLKDTVYYF